jgi:hypothetical protein
MRRIVAGKIAEQRDLFHRAAVELVLSSHALNLTRVASVGTWQWGQSPTRIVGFGHILGSMRAPRWPK